MEYAVTLTIKVIVNDRSEAEAVQQAVDLVEQISDVYVVGINSSEPNTYMIEA